MKSDRGAWRGLLWATASVGMVALSFTTVLHLLGSESGGRDESGGARAADSEFAWPPRLGEPFPDLQLVNQHGDRMRLSELRGKVILVEPVGMNCAACNAFSGAHRKGGYAGTRPQDNVPAIEELLPRYSRGITLDDSRIALVQLLLYDPGLKAPKAADARLWAEHFGFMEHRNVFVLAGDESLVGTASYNMIPGFFLIDRDFILRADATGHRPRHDLFKHLLPMVPSLL